MRKDLQRYINIKKSRLQAMQAKPIKNFFKIRKEKKRIQALEEGGRDILNTSVTDRTSANQEVDKNNYLTYEAQVTALYDMYEGTSTYGGELARSIVDMRTAFISGEGISFTTKNKEAEKIINEFIKYNKLNGSRLINMVETGELEGKNLIILKAVAKDKKIKARSFSWVKNKYAVKVNKADEDEIQEIKYTLNGEQKIIPENRSVFVKLGGSIHSGVNETPNRIHVVLTDIENASRAKYDLRKNTHVFGKTMPYFETDSFESAAAINAALESKSFEIGDGYAGTAKFSMVEPTGAAGKAIIDDILISLKNICTSTGIPILMMSWPELMSNRATADVLMESIIIATKLERLKWQEALEEIFYKMLVNGSEKGFWSPTAIADDIQVKLPASSIALLKQLVEVWQPLKLDETISEETFRNIIPGINAAEEKKLLKKQKEENIKNNPLLNGTMGNTLNNLQNNESEEEGAQGEDTRANAGQ